MSKEKAAKEKAIKEMSSAQAWNHVSALFGSSNVVHPEENSKVDIIETGSPSLDKALCIGGWARGRIIQLAGREGSGKTMLALLAMARWQSQDPENCCAFIDAEFTYDPVWAESLGIDNDRVLLVKTNEAIEIFTGLIGKASTKSPGLLRLIEEGQIISHRVAGRDIEINLGKMGIIVLDSIAAVQVPTEVEADVGKQNIAAVARFLSTELKKLTPAVASSNVAFIAINQVRINVGQMYGNPESSSGGRALKHACSVMIEVAPIGGAEFLLLDDNEEKMGHKLRARVSKNKFGPSPKTAEFFVNFKEGVVYTEDEVLALGVRLGIIEKPTTKSYVIDDQKFVGKENALEYIIEHKARLELEMRDMYLSGAKDVAFIDDEDTKTSEISEDSE